jgi:hypothetical protein
MEHLDLTVPSYMYLGVLTAPDLPALKSRITRPLDDPAMVELKRHMTTAFDKNRSFAIAIDDSSAIPAIKSGEIVANVELLDGHHRIALIKEEQRRRQAMHEEHVSDEDEESDWASNTTLVYVLVYICNDRASRITIAYGAFEN